MAINLILYLPEETDSLNLQKVVRRDYGGIITLKNQNHAALIFTLLCFFYFLI